jgi:hypothetical protein
MNCLEFDTYLQELLDGAAVEPAPAVVLHLAGCTRCRELHQAARLLRGEFPIVTPPIPPPDLGQRVVARFLAERRAHRVWRFRLLGVAAAAALLLLAFPLLWRLMPTTNPAVIDAPKQLVKNDTTPERPVPSSLKTTVDEARQAMVNLTGRLADDAQKQAQLLLSAAPKELPMNSIPGMGITEPDLSPNLARQSLQEVSANVSTGVQSVTNTARQAVDYFSRELPAFGKKSKGS